MSICLGIDVGGTFTDVAILDRKTAAIRVHKVSTTSHDPAHGILLGMQQALTMSGLRAQEVTYLAHGTTVGINALLQSRGANVLLFTTAGFRDLLEIRRQKRPHLYDLFADKPATLIPRKQRFEVSERIDASGRIVRPLDEDSVDAAIKEALTQLDAAPEAIAICLLFSFLNPTHEERLQTLLQRHFPETYITISSTVAPEFREFERLGTTVLNACLGPVMKRYLTSFADRVAEAGVTTRPYIAQSNGGILSIEQACRLPVRTIASGPSMGVVGAVQVAEVSDVRNLLTFDMGGTSTDICLVKEGEPLVTTNRSVAGLPVKSPMLDVHSIGAGGGSIAWVDEAGALWVGPQSAGAVPGPACYGRSGEEPTVTDANVVLGRLNPEGLLDGALPIEPNRALAALEKCIATRLRCSIEEAATGILDVVVANMTRALRLVSVERGEDPAAFTLTALGGAGPLHAAQVAESLGCQSVLVPPNPGILCGIGLLLSAPHMDFVRSRRVALTSTSADEIAHHLDALTAEAISWFESEKIPADARTLLRRADIRYRRQNFELTVDVPTSDESSSSHVVSSVQFDTDALAAVFHEAYEKQYGYAMHNEPLDVINLRVTAMGRQQTTWRPSRRSSVCNGQGTQHASIQPVMMRRVTFAGDSAPTPIYRRDHLQVADRICGPAVIEQYDSTTVVPPGWQAVSDTAQNLLLTRTNHKETAS